MGLTPADKRAAWGSKHGWSLFALLGAALLAFGMWALFENRAALAGAPTAIAAGFLAVALYLWAKRERG